MTDDSQAKNGKVGTTVRKPRRGGCTDLNPCSGEQQDRYRCLKLQKPKPFLSGIHVFLLEYKNLGKGANNKRKSY